MSTFNWIIIIFLVIIVGMALYESYQFNTGRGEHYGLGTYGRGEHDGMIYGMDDSDDGIVEDSEFY